jgi:hypothetical protein
VYSGVSGSGAQGRHLTTEAELARVCKPCTWSYFGHRAHVIRFGAGIGCGLERDRGINMLCWARGVERSPHMDGLRPPSDTRSSTVPEVRWSRVIIAVFGASYHVIRFNLRYEQNGHYDAHISATATQAVFSTVSEIPSSTDTQPRYSRVELCAPTDILPRSTLLTTAHTRICQSHCFR